MRSHNNARIIRKKFVTIQTKAESIIVDSDSE